MGEHVACSTISRIEWNVIESLRCMRSVGANSRRPRENANSPRLSAMHTGTPEVRGVSRIVGVMVRCRQRRYNAYTSHLAILLTLLRHDSRDGPPSPY